MCRRTSNCFARPPRSRHDVEPLRAVEGRFALPTRGASRTWCAAEVTQWVEPKRGARWEGHRVKRTSWLGPQTHFLVCCCRWFLDPPSQAILPGDPKRAYPVQRPGPCWCSVGRRSSGLRRPSLAWGEDLGRGSPCPSSDLQPYSRNSHSGDQAAAARLQLRPRAHGPKHGFFVRLTSGFLVVHRPRSTVIVAISVPTDVVCVAPHLSLM